MPSGPEKTFTEPVAATPVVSGVTGLPGANPYTWRKPDLVLMKWPPGGQLGILPFTAAVS